MSFIIALVCFSYAGNCIFRYIKSTFNLLENVQEKAPEIWENLGRPEKVWIKSSKGGMHTIQALWPWLNWVWECEIHSLDRKLGFRLKKTGGLLKRGLIAFALTLVSFLYVIVITPPS